MSQEQQSNQSPLPAGHDLIACDYFFANNSSDNDFDDDFDEEDNFDDDKKIPKPNITIPLQTLIDIKARIIGGATFPQMCREYHLPAKVLEDRLLNLDSLISSDSPSTSLERKIIEETLSDHLKPIKTKLSFNSLEIIDEADKIVLERLKTNPDELSTKDVLRASDVHSKRLARITGLEEDPDAGKDNGNLERVKTVNVFIKNTFREHREKLEKERRMVNDTTPTPVYDGDIVENKE